MVVGCPLPCIARLSDGLASCALWDRPHGFGDVVGRVMDGDVIIVTHDMLTQRGYRWLHVIGPSGTAGWIQNVLVMIDGDDGDEKKTGGGP